MKGKANRVKNVRWFLIGSVCLLCSATWVRGDEAADLYNQGVTALQNQQFDAAAKFFDSVIAGYPTSPDIDKVRVWAGFCYLQAGKYPEAVDRLSKEVADTTKPLRGSALYFTALAQFSMGQKNADKNQLSQAVTTLTSLINLITTAPTSDNQGYQEQAIYYRALAQYLQGNYNDAEKDLLQVIQKFPASLSRPDYYLRLGSVYAEETNQAVTDMTDEKKKAADANESPNEIAAIEAKARDKIQAQADKALNTLDKVSTDPNALVQANEANMDKAEILFLIAQLDTTPAGYEKALDAFRQVHRKADMIPLQQDRLDELKKQSQQHLQNSPTALSSDSSLLIAREENRLKDLQSETDPIIKALIRMAECYISITRPDGTHESDEARTILHRLVAHAKLATEQQQEVDFQILYSYVLGGQTDKADKALTDYIIKHGGDPNIDSISYQIAAKLMERKDYAGALNQADRSLRDFPFPKGRYAAGAIALKAEALTRLGRIAESDKVIDDFLTKNPTSPVANSMLVTKAQSESARQAFDAALADYRKVKDNQPASPDLRASADVGYIQTLNSLHKYDEEITEAKVFATQYPKNTALPSVLLFAGMAMDQKHDPGAVAALQDLAQKYPKDDTTPFALYYVVKIYKEAGNVPALLQAAKDLNKACPEAYTFLLLAANDVSAISIKAKKFDDAIALYQPLTEAPKPEVAASARNKIGDIWLTSAKSLGYYQSMALPMRAEAEKRLSSAEQAFVGTLKSFPDQLNAVGNAFDGLVTAGKQRRSWGLLKDAELEGYLEKFGTEENLTTPQMQARLELAKAGLVFVYKNGASQYAAALDRYKKVIDANPGLRLTRQETYQYGELLLAAHDYPAALKVYGDLLNNTDPNDPVAQGDANYGLGAAYLGQGDLAQAKNYFMKMRNDTWHPHILDADNGIALADEKSGQTADLDEARQIYAQLMQIPPGHEALQAKALLGYGRLLEKSGNAITPTAAGPNEYAVHYYQEPHVLLGAATPAQSAEGLYDAGQAYAKAGDKANAKKQYDDLLKNYSDTAPDWAAKAQTAEAQLGP